MQWTENSEEKMSREVAKLRGGILMDQPVPKSTHGIDRELIKEIATDIGKAVVEHIETMYPAAIEVTPSTFKLSVRNCVSNEIMAALEVSNADAIRERLMDRKKNRRQRLRTYRLLREGKAEEALKDFGIDATKL
jgi:hypothetical protein